MMLFIIAFKESRRCGAENTVVSNVYSHRWQQGLRSAAIGGYAEAETEEFQPGTTFNNTVYAGANLLWSPLSYLTLGVEYVYGKSENQDGSDQDDHRILFGAQFF